MTMPSSSNAMAVRRWALRSCRDQHRT
jgi:hypothetical protein